MNENWFSHSKNFLNQNSLSKGWIMDCLPCSQYMPMRTVIQNQKEGYLLMSCFHKYLLHTDHLLTHLPDKGNTAKAVSITGKLDHYTILQPKYFKTCKKPSIYEKPHFFSPSFWSVCLLVWDRATNSPGCTWIYYLVENDLELLILLNSRQLLTLLPLFPIR